MVVLKCKMCGGDVVTTPEMSCGTCGHCGSAMTLPRVSDERRANLFNRANHFRRLNEFDKAVAAYESILNENNADAEAHWGVVLSRYGIEYVEDPGTHERLPTCHRVQSDSILRDPDYLMALEHAPDNGAMALYQAQAAAIGEIQKGILALSAQEEPFDVFICYKETTDGGSRSRDSVLAQDIYHQLTREKCRVFFARIALENRLGQAYEPCIFAAINSAKVMVVVGTKPEHFTAVWVRNEWSRFLSLRKQDSRKLIIPCYQEMNPYQLPEELSALQSQDMGKLGFLQDLVRGIKKVLDAGKQATVQSGSVDSAATSEVTALAKRATLFLEDKDFESAGEYAERILDKNPECAEAYVVKLMVQLCLRTEDELGNGTEPLKGNSHYQKAVRFSTGALKQRLEGYNRNRIEAAEKVRQEKLEQEQRERQEKLEQEHRERERNGSLLAKAGELIDRGDLDSAAKILASLERATAGYLEIDARLQFLRGELTTAAAVRQTLERLGVEVAEFSPFPKWALRGRCRFAQFEASENIRNLQTAAATYPGSEFAISAADSLQQTLREFERRALPGVNHQVRVLSGAWLVLILILGAVGTTVVVGNERTQAKLAAEAEAKREAEEAHDRNQAKLAAWREEREQAKLAAETEAKREAEERAQAKLAAETEAKREAEERAQAKLTAEIRAKWEAGEAKRKAEEAKLTAEIRAKWEAGEAKRKVEERAQAKLAAEAEAKLEKTESIDLGGGVRMESILIRSGAFEMGAALTGAVEEEFYSLRHSALNGVPHAPAHRVRLTKPYYLGKYEVTCEQWISVMGGDLGDLMQGGIRGEIKPKWPVTGVSWNKCHEFLGKLQKKSGKKFDLPTEAQWEYACRAGTTTRYSFGDSDAGVGEYAWAWYANAIDTEQRPWHVEPHPVGLKKPNPWGLYDMHGNVAELCAEWCRPYQSGDKTDTREPVDAPPEPPNIHSFSGCVVRGSGQQGKDGCANRGKFERTESHSLLGFRCVREL